MAKSIFLKLIDDQITKQLKPFMESGIGPDGEDEGPPEGDLPTPPPAQQVSVPVEVQPSEEQE